MEDIDIALIKKKSFEGIIALTSRTLVLQIIAFSATFLLTIFLSPAIFGVFYVVSAVISFLGYFSDVGLAASLIQKKEELTQEDLTTTFTIQQILIGTVVLLSLIFSNFIGKFYHLDNAGMMLLRSLLIAFFLSSLKTIPSVLLERKLDFQTLVIPQIFETLGFYIVAVVLAWRGWGITSFTWAVLVRAVVGLVGIYILAPWRISLGISVPVAKKLLRFGVPFQLNSFLALLKDDLLTIYLGRALPFAQVGYIGWAKKWAEVPLRLIMDSVIRVTFPAFSRIQHSKELLQKAIERTLFGLSASIFPITVGLIFFIHPLMNLVPRYGKWEPALTSFYLFAVASAISSLSTPLTNALNAVGRIRITLMLMILWTISTWALTMFFMHFFGFNGVALALLVITSTVALVVYFVRKISDFAFFGSIAGPFIAALFQGAWYVVIIPTFHQTLPFLLACGLSGIIVYGLFLWTIEKTMIQSVYRSFVKPL